MDPVHRKMTYAHTCISTEGGHPLFPCHNAVSGSGGGGGGGVGPVHTTRARGGGGGGGGKL